MSKYISTFIVTSSIGFAAALALTAPSATVHAQVAGEWTKCIAWLADGTQIHPVNGQSNSQACYQAAMRCAVGRPFGHSTYYSSPVIVNAPYERCTR